MKVIICGAGQVGTTIAKYLSNEDHDVTVIDQSEELIKTIKDNLEVRAIVGFASYPAVLEEAGAESADMIIAVTLSDEINMIACQVANSLFQVPMKIARVRNYNYLTSNCKGLYSKGHLPIDYIISPEIEIARSLVEKLHIPGAIDSVEFGDGLAKVISVKIVKDCIFSDITIKQADTKLQNFNSRILGIIRDDKFFIPNDSEKIKISDQLYFIVDEQNLYQVMDVFKYDENPSQTIRIVGGGNIGLYIASELEKEPNLKVKIIEINQKRAEYIADQLPKTTVINGNALDPEILNEVSIFNTDVVVAVTNDDEVNILSSLLAKRLGCKNAITLIGNRSYSPLFSTLGLDVIVNPREITISMILQKIRKGKINKIQPISDNKAEVIEVEITNYSYVAGKKVKELEQNNQIKIGGIIKDNQFVIPMEDSLLEVGNKVIVLALNDTARKTEKIFESEIKYV